MILDGIGNALKARVSGTYSNSATTITLDSNVFSVVPEDHNLVLFDRSQGDPADAKAAGKFEVLRRDASADSGAIITVTRAQEGTTAITIGTGDWVVMLSPTKRIFDQIETAVDGKADSSHTHTESEITDLGSYSVVGHTHTEADIVDLGNYSVVGHTHLASNITDFDTAVSTNSDVSANTSKLAGIDSNANNYIHPATHPPSIIAEDASNRFVTDTQINTWNSKADGSHSHSTSDITSGTFADARIAQSNVTQHEGALTIGIGQITPESPTSKSAGWTFSLSDALYYRYTGAGSANATVPPNSSVAYTVGTVVYIEQAGAGVVTATAGAGVTINSLDGAKTGGQYDVIALKKVATDTWTVIGGVA